MLNTSFYIFIIVLIFGIAIGIKLIKGSKNKSVATKKDLTIEITSPIGGFKIKYTDDEKINPE